MVIEQKRQDELQKLSVRVYQQIQAGMPVAEIKHQFDDIEDADPEEVAWVIGTGKQRYFGYFDAHRRMNEDGAKWMILGSLALIVIVAVILLTLGWPTAGRQKGIAVAGMLLSAAGLIVGIKDWVRAEPTGKRSDLEAL